MVNRAHLSWKIHDAIQRLGASTSIEQKLHWARILVTARRERGDYPEIQALDTETEDVLVKQAVLGQVVNQEGERHD